MRALRVFFVGAQFMVDNYHCRGNMRCKARQELCTTNGVLRCDALSHVCAPNPFTIRTYEKYSRKPFRMCTYKIIGLKAS